MEPTKSDLTETYHRQSIDYINAAPDMAERHARAYEYAHARKRLEDSSSQCANCFETVSWMDISESFTCPHCGRSVA